MRKFLCRLSVFVVYALIIQVVLPIAVDPANVFHAEHIRQLPSEPNKNYIKMKYILANPDKFSGYMFGSSRVGSIHTEKINDGNIYNMTYSMGVPVEHLANIRTMLTNNVRPSVIYMGLDGISYLEKAENHLSQPWRCPYEYLHNDPEYFYSLMLNPYYSMRALLRIITSTTPKDKSSDPDIFYSYGWWADYDTNLNFDWNKVRYIYKQNDKTYNRKIISKALDIIMDIADLCRDNNVRLVLFTNPMYCVTHMETVDMDYMYFLEGLAKIADFWNLSSLNDITMNKANYIDSSHYNSYIGDKMIHIMCSGDTYQELQAQGFGVKVTNENVKDFINFLKQQAEDYRHNNSPAH